MMYPIFALIFFLSVIMGLLFSIGIIFKPYFWTRNLRKIQTFYAIWFTPYFVFILFFTGPEDLSKYPPREGSLYRLPWQAGVTRILSQGNRSFTSHRGSHFYAWDFVMPDGTKILAAREGTVVEVEQSFLTVGLKGNFILIRHSDGQISGYYHIQKNGALVKVGDAVKQGQEIALSGMTGQTTLPHLHFVVLNSDKTASVPISFRDVDTGVPLAGHFYTSGNSSD